MKKNIFVTTAAIVIVIITLTAVIFTGCGDSESESAVIQSTSGSTDTVSTDTTAEAANTIITTYDGYYCGTDANGKTVILGGEEYTASAHN